MLDPLEQDLFDQMRAKLKAALRDMPLTTGGQPVTAAEARLVDLYRKIPVERRSAWIRLGIRLRNRLPECRDAAQP